MRLFWQGRARDDDFLDAVRPELHALETPKPSEALRARILSSRNDGVRAILPDVPRPRMHSRGIRIAVAIAVALLVTRIPWELSRSKAPSDDLASPGFFGQPAQAQTLSRGKASRLAPARVTTAARLRGVSVTFTRRLADSVGHAIDSSAIALEMRDVAVDGARAWRVAWREQHRRGRGETRAETVYVHPVDLRLLRRDIHVAPYSRFERINVHQWFAGDSVNGRMFTEGPSIGEGRSIHRRLPPDFGPYLTEALAPVFLMAVSLGRSWSGSASLLGWAVRDDDVSTPIELRVEGEETVSVPAGLFDCWRLSIRLSGSRVDYWARKRDGLGVRVFSRDPRTKGTREIVLTREN
jgi:hypothetical protein